jgi:hypothetical protein
VCTHVIGRLLPIWEEHVCEFGCFGASVEGLGRGVNHCARCRTPAAATRSAYLRTGVKEVLTLLGKSRRLISNTMGVCFTRGMTRSLYMLMDNGRTPSAGRCAMDNQPTEDHEMMVEWLVTSAMRLREERHLRTAMAGMGEWSRRG